MFMEKKWSAKWNSSVQPRKQRKFKINAPLHAKRKLTSAHLAPSLRERYGTRSIPMRKGDQVQILRGSSKGLKGQVDRVDVSRSKVYIEGIKTKKADGSELMKPIVISNVMITSLSLDDKRRVKSIEKKSGKKIKIEPKKETPKIDTSKIETPKIATPKKETSKTTAKGTGEKS